MMLQPRINLFPRRFPLYVGELLMFHSGTEDIDMTVDVKLSDLFSPPGFEHLYPISHVSPQLFFLFQTTPLPPPIKRSTSWLPGTDRLTTPLHNTHHHHISLSPCRQWSDTDLSQSVSPAAAIAAQLVIAGRMWRTCPRR